MSQPAISKHLKVLERAGLISRGREAQRRPRRLEARPLREATEWMEKYRQFWAAQFGRLDVLLLEMQSGEKRKRGKRVVGKTVREAGSLRQTQGRLSSGFAPDSE
jgi:DNA-binding transcriptional ArsR family regulator